MFWGPHFHLVFLIHLYNKICLVKDVRKVHFEESPQTTFWTHKLEFFQSSKKPQQWPQFIGILHISLVAMTMNYHTYQHNGQFSKLTNHFVCHLQPWERSFGIIHFVMDNASLDLTDLHLQLWYNLLHDSCYKRCFLNFISYFLISLLFLPNFDIKSFSDSHKEHFAKIEPFFITSTLKWCLFFNLLIAKCEIFPMFNSLLNCENVI